MTQPLDPPIHPLDPEPLLDARKRWTRWLGPAVSVAVLIGIVWWFKHNHGDLVRIMDFLPKLSPLFWGVFIIGYLVGPVTDWVIFRRLWGISFWGILALLRKQVSNNILPSYSGELYFYTWARKHHELTHAPFGAVKDVAILSALTGNITTLILLIAAYPLFGSLIGGILSQSATLEMLGWSFHVSTFSLIAASFSFVMLSSTAIMFFRGSLFSLPKEELWYICLLVELRLIISTLVTAFLWHLIMPDIDLHWWLLFASIKLLLTRLPFIPNQDVLFASVATVLLSHAGLQAGHVTASALITLVWLVTILFTLTHVLFGLVLGIMDITSWSET